MLRPKMNHQEPDLLEDKKGNQLKKIKTHLSQMIKKTNKPLIVSVADLRISDSSIDKKR